MGHKTIRHTTRRNGIYYVRFRLSGKKYFRKSLETDSYAQAHSVMSFASPVIHLVQCGAIKPDQFSARLSAITSRLKQQADHWLAQQFLNDERREVQTQPITAHEYRDAVAPAVVADQKELTEPENALTLAGAWNMYRSEKGRSWTKAIAQANERFMEVLLVVLGASTDVKAVTRQDIKQVMEDGFFHADPHSGNVKIRDGKIIWIDMGMMGRLTERDRELIGNAVQGIALNDIGMIQEAVLALGEFKEKPDQNRLYKDIDGLLLKYGNVDMGKINVAEVMTDLMDVMKENKIAMPHGLTMLARGLTHMEGVLASLSPDINMVEIASAHMAGEVLRNKDWKKEAKAGGRSLYRSLKKALDIPALTADIMHGYLKGQTRINLDLHAADDLALLLRRLVRNIVMGLWVMALLISSSIICTTDMSPKIWGIPALGAFGYLMAFGIVMYVFLKHIFSKK